MGPTENNIIIRLRRSDKEAFQLVYWEYRQPVFGLALRYLKDPQLAEDAVQDVFLKLWMNRGDLDSEKSLRGLLFTSLKNHVLNMIKSQRRRIERQYEYSRYTENQGENPEKNMAFADVERIHNEGIKKLPERKQLIYKLKSLDGFTNSEIAVRLGVSVHTVKSQFYKANKFIRDFMTTHADS